MSRRAVWVAVWFVVGGFLGVGAQQQSPSAINEYCTGCHNQSAKTAGLALDSISAENVNRHPEVWEKVEGLILREITANSAQ